MTMPNPPQNPGPEFAPAPQPLDPGSQPYLASPGFPPGMATPQSYPAMPGAQPGYPQPGFPQPGYPQPGYQPGYPPPGPAPVKKNNTAVIVIIAVVVLALAGAGIWYYTSHNNGGTIGPTNPTTTPFSPVSPINQNTLDDADSDEFMGYVLDGNAASSYEMFGSSLKQLKDQAEWADELDSYGFTRACELQWDSVSDLDTFKIVSGELTCGTDWHMVMITWDKFTSNTYLVSTFLVI